MATPVTMPRLGETVAEGTIGGWLKKEGDWVERDESLAEIITDKINAELPSPVEGRLVKILVQVDETVPVGAQIALIEEQASVTTSPTVEHVAPEQVLSHTSATYGNDNLVAINGNGKHAKTAGTDEERQRISPLARRLAREHDLDLNLVQGTGTGGRVRKEDILAYISQRISQPQPTLPKPLLTPTPVTSVASANVATEPASVVGGGSVVGGTASVSLPPYIPGADEEVLVPDRMRLAIAEHMVRSKRTSPHATAVVEVDMTTIAKWLEKNKADFKKQRGFGISFVPFVIQAVCEGLRNFPLLNSSWTPDDKIVLKKHINVGLAVATDSGLVVPTIYDADQYNLVGLANKINDMAVRARANKLKLDDLQNSTFCVNNVGTFGTIISIPIINQPNAGILAMNAVVKRPVVIEDDAIAVRSMMYLCLSFDHRILDGAGSGGFLKTVREKLEGYSRDFTL
jgi:pyruvate/2-oxoglutarate dehydrogenase complex dihydrolipoamide acyltransferase (E2) component